MDWDQSSLVSTNIFLGQPRGGEISEAARELTTIVAAEEYQGKKQAWPAILLSELEKAAIIQNDFPALQGREIEQAVFATFLHSQPIGQKASIRDLLTLIGHTRPDKIELEKAMRQWANVSWFLDDALTQEAETTPDGGKQLPKSWRLGSRPNLTQMHYDACQTRIPDELVEARLVEEIGKLKTLTGGVSVAGVKVHNLPEWPKQIEDDGEFHFVVLGPKAASNAGKPSPEASRFIQETTGADRPRVYRNAIVLAVPSFDGLDAARKRILDYLGWEEVRVQLKDQQVDPLREQLLTINLETSRKQIPDAIRQAYCIVVTVSEKNDIQALRVTPGVDPLFTVIKRESRVRIQETAVSSEALLPGGPYDLWHAGDTVRRLKDLVTAFAQFPHLPKMLNRQAILDTLVDGCRLGMFVLRLSRPDRSYRTFWRQTPDEAAVKDPALEVVLPEAATLTEIVPQLLAPNALPGLWNQGEVKVAQLYDYFSGEHVEKVPKEGYEEPVIIPKATTDVVEKAIQEAVKNSVVWLVSGTASILAEEIPVGLLMPDALLLPPPTRLSTMDVLPDRLPEAWQGEQTTVLAIASGLSYKVGRPLPWHLVKDALDGAFNARYLERTADSGNWPCDYGGAQWVKVRVAKETPPPQSPPPLRPGVRVSEAELKPHEIQDLADVMGELGKTTAGYDMKFYMKLELGGTTPPPDEIVDKVNELLKDVSTGLHLK